MSVITFELKKEHLLLLKNLSWSINKNNIISNVANTDADDNIPPFGEDNLYEAIDLILNGKPDNINQSFQYEFFEYSEDKRKLWDKLYSELPMALEIILFNGHFELGTYKTRFNIRDWKKIN